MLLTEMRRGVVASVLFLGCASAPEKPPPPPAPPAAEAPMPPELQGPVARSCEIGRRLYALEQAQAVGADVLRANVPDAEKHGVAGSIPVQEGDDQGKPAETIVVSFFTADDPPRIAYEIRVAPNAKPAFSPYAPPKESAPALAAMIRARKIALSSMPATKQPVNSFVVPGETKADVFVYLLAGSTKPNVAVFGKHYRALVPLVATSPTYVMPVNNLELELPTKTESGEAVKELVVNHAATEYPAETHVFTSLLHKLPIYVGTSRGNFRVDGDKITFMGEKGPRKID
jgi:hypothetical protein